MDPKYPRFVAYSALVAQEYLRDVLPEGTAPPIELLKDAARIGLRKARERFFPGLPRDPFQMNPLDDVVLGLRHYYESDPEAMDSGGYPRVKAVGDTSRYPAPLMVQPPTPTPVPKPGSPFPFSPKKP